MNKILKLPKPKHNLGYTSNEIEKFMTQEEVLQFDKWISNQTCAVGEDKKLIFYTWDVARFLKQQRFKTRTYWD